MTRVPDEIRSEPPSVKLVWYTLRQKGEATQKQLRSATGLHRHTLTDALERLEDAGLADRAGYDTHDLRTPRWEIRDA